METDYNNWSYSMPAYTICTDYANETFIDEYYQRSEKVTSINNESEIYKEYQKYMRIIGALNAENIHSIDRFEDTKLFENLTGEEIFDIALNVRIHLMVLSSDH